MADIEIAVKAKNEASAALAAVNRDLENVAKQAAETGQAFVSIGRTQFSLGASGTALRDMAQDLRNATEQANTLKQTLSVPAQVRNAGGVENVTLSIKQAEAELDRLLKQYQELANAGKLNFGAGTTENLVQAQTAIAKQKAELDNLKKAAIEAGKAGILGDGSAAARQIAETTKTTQLLGQQLDTVAGKAQKAQKAVEGVGKGGGAQQAKEQIAGIDKAFGNLSGALTGGIGGVAGLVGLGATAAAIGAVGAAINDAVQAADRVDKLKFSFDNLATSAGQSGDQMLKSLRAASNGMVSDADLILSANKAMLLGVASNADEMGTLFEIARARGQAMGLDVTQAFNDIVTGLGRGSALILDNLGITIDAASANEEYAKSIGKVASQLTEQEKKQALINATLAQSKNITRGGGSGAATASAQAQVSQQNLQVEAGRFFAPGERDFLQAQSDAIAVMTGKYDQLAIALREINDLQADSKSDSPFAAKVEPADLANAQALANAIVLLNQAQAAGVDNLDEYRSALEKLNAETRNGVNMNQQQENRTALITSGLQEEIAAHNAKVTALQRANAEASRSAPYYQQIAAAQDEAAAASFRASEEAQKLAEGFGFAGRIALAASDNVDELNQALGRLRAKDAISNTADSARQSAINKARSVVQQGVDSGRLTVEQGATAFNNLVTQINGIPDPTNTATTTLFRFDNQLAQVTTGTEAANKAFDDQNAAAKRLADEGLAAVKAKYDDIQGKVAGLIADAQNLPTFKASDLFKPDELKNLGLSGDSQISVDQAANGGRAPDAINENAKRLMAIAKEGLANQPWLEEFKKEVPNVFKELEQSTDVKGTAFRMLKEFEQGFRPELLDRGMIKDRVKAMIIGDQNAAALANEIAQEIAQEMGISVPQAMQATQAALGITPADGAGTANAAAPDMTPQGQAAGKTLRDGMVSGFDASGMTVEILAKVDAEFGSPKSWLAINKSGATVGAVWGGGFLAGASGNIPPGLYDILLNGLVPLMVAALAGNGSRTGAQP